MAEQEECFINYPHSDIVLGDSDIESHKHYAAEQRQLVEWLTELKELRKLTVINPITAGYNEVYEKLIKGDIEASNDKDLLKTAVETLENVMPKYRRLIEENQKQKEQIAEYKRLLKAAVEDFTAIAEVHAAATPILCPQYGKYMKAIDVHTRKWRYADKALALIGEGGDTE